MIYSSSLPNSDDTSGSLRIQARWKSVIGLLSLVFLAVAGLSCGGSEEGTKSLTLRVAINAGPEGSAIKQLADAYSDAQIEIVELPYETLREQLLTRLVTADPKFDVVMIDDPWFPELAPYLRALTAVPQTP